MMATLAFNELMPIASEALNIWILILKNLFARYVFISSLYEVERHFPFCHMSDEQKKLAFHPAALLKQQVTKLMVSD